MWAPYWGVMGDFSPAGLSSRLEDRQPTTTIAPLMLDTYQVYTYFT